MENLKKCFIWGAGELGLSILPILEKEGVKVVAFGDNCIDKMVTWGDRIPVFAEEVIVSDLKAGAVDFIIVAIKDCNARMEVARNLYSLGVTQIKLAPEYLQLYKEGNERKFLSELEDIDYVKPIMQHLEVDVSEICNLNCKGCGHYSNVVEKQRNPFLDLDEFKNDISRLSELFSEIKLVEMLGGEPLLNPDLGSYILIVKKFFPQACIRIMTNGLLVEKMPLKLMEIMRENSVQIDISLYPPTVEKLYDIQRFLHKNSLIYTCRYKIEYFYKYLVKPENYKQVEKKLDCPTRKNYQLYHGKVYCCPVAALVNKYNRIFNMEINAGAKDYVDIYEEGITGWDLFRKFSKQPSMCCWCNNGRPEYYKWEVGGSISKEDWLQQNVY